MKKTKSEKTRIALICSGIVLSIIVVIAAIALSMGSIGRSTNNSTSENDDSNNSVNVDDEDDENDELGLSALSSVSSEDVISIMEGEYSVFLYVGRPTCPHCSEFAPILTKVVKEGNYLVYYYDTDAANADADLKSEALGAIDVTGVPAFLYIENGVVADRLSDRNSEEALITFLDSHL